MDEQCREQAQQRRVPQLPQQALVLVKDIRRNRAPFQQQGHTLRCRRQGQPDEGHHAHHDQQQRGPLPLLAPPGFNMDEHGVPDSGLLET